jgi:hypothetical protein
VTCEQTPIDLNGEDVIFLCYSSITMHNRISTHVREGVRFGDRLGLSGDCRRVPRERVWFLWPGGDAFAARGFHGRCNGCANTLTIIADQPRPFRRLSKRPFHHIIEKVGHRHMARAAPALLAFAQRNTKEEQPKDTKYRYLMDVGFEPEEVKNWGRIGSLIEALQTEQDRKCEGCTLDEKAFLDFVAGLPPGNTPRRAIRPRIHRSPVV